MHLKVIKIKQINIRKFPCYVNVQFTFRAQLLATSVLVRAFSSISQMPAAVSTRSQFPDPRIFMHNTQLSLRYKDFGICADAFARLATEPANQEDYKQ